MNELERDILQRTWFYRFKLPSGAVTRSYDDGVLDAIHETRLAMMDRALAAHLPQGLTQVDALHLAYHQGYFSTVLSRLR